MNVLIVCHGNLNRSPAAEIILRRLRPGWTIRSAGLAMSCRPGRVMSKKMRETLATRGEVFEPLRTTVVSREMIDVADLVLYMDDGNRRRLMQMFGDEVFAKARGLGSFVGEPRIPDPHFNGTHVQVIDLIELALIAFVETIQ